MVSLTAAAFYFYKLSDTCCEAKRCKHLSWVCTKASQAFSETFSGTLLNLTWLCSKTSQTFSGNFSGTLLNMTWLCTITSPEPSPEPC